MSNDSPNFERRQHSIKAARRRLQRLEIEAHRIKAYLARLEADCEEDAADWLSRKLRRRQRTNQRFDGPHCDEPRGPHVQSLPTQAAPETRNEKLARRSRVDRSDADLRTNPEPGEAHESETSIPTVVVEANSAALGPRKKERSRQEYRQTARPLAVSFALHAVLLALCTTFGFVTLAQQSPQLFANPSEVVDDSAEEFSEIKIESTTLEDTELQNVLSENDEFNIADSSVREFEPSQLGMGTEPLGDVGQLDSLPSELGTLMAGAASPGSGSPGGELGDAVFFGARSHGNRIVFVVDNSSSMKDGRLEAAVAELVRSVEALSPKQAFYVIFVSDQPYPMFFPQSAADLLPATPPNKKRLAEWLPKALLASGKNREMIKAMDMAASLRPHAVYLLWDGDMKYSERVRTEVMTHLTRPNQWNFSIHTVGMGITSHDAEFNLTAIAEAHGGTYRRVDVPTNRGR